MLQLKASPLLHLCIQLLLFLFFAGSRSLTVSTCHSGALVHAEFRAVLTHVSSPLSPHRAPSSTSILAHTRTTMRCAPLLSLALLALTLLALASSIAPLVDAKTTVSHKGASASRSAALRNTFRAALDATEASVGSATSWSCATLSTRVLTAGVTWRRLNCSAVLPFWGLTGPATINTVEADLTVGGLRLQPLQAALVPKAEGGTGFLLQPLNAMAASSGNFTTGTPLVGINGGYFYRLDHAGFFDTVCQGKNAAEASQAPQASEPNFGTGDGALIVNGQVLSNNCNCTGFNRPAVLEVGDVAAGVAPTISVLTEGAPVSAAGGDAIAAGPYLVSTNSSGTFVSIPADDENLGNILEHAANTGLALKNGGKTALLFTFDGHDGCAWNDPSCGFNAFQLAYFAKDYLGAETAMGMDQGGSTTMFIADQGAEGIVSNAGGGTVRPVFDGLFLMVDASRAEETNNLVTME